MKKRKLLSKYIMGLGLVCLILSIFIPSLSASVESSYVYFGDISIFSAYIFGETYYDALTNRHGGLSNTRFPPRLAKIICIISNKNIEQDIGHRFSSANDLFDKSLYLYLLVALGQHSLFHSEKDFIESILLNKKDILYYDVGNTRRSNYIYQRPVKNILMALQLYPCDEYTDILYKALNRPEFRNNIEIRQMIQDIIDLSTSS